MTDDPIHSWYEEENAAWNAMPPDEQAAARRELRRHGLAVDAGRPVSYYVEVVNANGDLSMMLHPSHWRDMAMSGRQEARAFCEARHIPWRADDEEFDAWCKDWLKAMRRKVEAARGRMQPSTVPPAGKREAEARRERQLYQAGPGSDADE